MSEVTPTSDAVDLAEMLGQVGDGVHWTLEGSNDLNANLVRLDPHHEIGAHVNGEVDVLLVVLAGSGTLRQGDEHVELRPQVVALAVRGAERSVHAGPDGIGYLTVHRKRRLTVGFRRSDPA